MSATAKWPLREMLWGGGEDIASIVADVNRWSAHAEVERSEPIPEPPRSGRHADRRYRTEPVKLARRRHRAWRGAPAVEEARGRRERIAEVAASMARRSGEGGASDQTHRCRFRGRP